MPARKMTINMLPMLNTSNLSRRNYFDFLMLCSLVTVVASFLIRETFDADTWWQVAIGRDIIANLSVPRTDHFALAAWGNPYHDSHWLFQVVLAISDNIAGMRGVSLVMVFLWAATFYFSFKSLRLWLSNSASAALVFFVVIACLDRFTPRPDLVTCLMISIYYYLLQNDRFLSAKDLAVFVILQTVWANSHGLFVVGPFMVLCYSFTEVLKYARGDGNSKVKKSLLLMVLVFVSSLLTPFGVNGWKYSFLLAREAGSAGHEVFKNLPELMSLFNPAVWKYYDFWAFVVVFACFVATLGYSAYNKKIQYSRLLIVAGLLLCAVSGRRNIPFFVLTAVPYVAEHVSKMPFSFAVPKVFKALFAVAMIVLSWFPLSGRYYEATGYPARFGIGESPSFYPDELPRYLKRINFKGTIYNSGSLGGFALYHGYIPMIDGRWEVYDGKTLSWLLSVPFSDVEWQRMVSRYGVKGVLLQHMSPEAIAILPRISKDRSWRLAYVDLAASFWIYSENGTFPFETYRAPKNTVPQRVESYLMLSDFYRLTGERNVARSIIQEAISRGHDKLNILESMGRLQVELGLMAEAEQTYKRIILKHNKNISSLNELAFLCYSRGDLNSAENYLNAALEIDSDDNNTKANYRMILDAKSRKRNTEPQR